MWFIANLEYVLQITNYEETTGFSAAMRSDKCLRQSLCSFIEPFLFTDRMSVESVYENAFYIGQPI